MTITKIYIRDFGSLSNKEIDLSPGLNVIQGENETGKSTLFAFVKFIFYGMTRSEKEKYMPWGKASCSGSLTFESSGETFRIEREALESRTKDKVSVFSSNGGEIANPDVSEFFGVSEGVFTQSAFTGQLSGTYVNGQALPDAIENILFSGDESVGTAKALKKLDQARTDLWHKNKKGGQIFNMKQEITKLEISLENAAETAKTILSLEEKVRSDTKLRDKKRQEVILLEEKLEEYEAYSNLECVAKYENARKLVAESGDKLAALQEKYTVNGFLPDKKYLDRLNSLAGDLLEKRVELSAKESELARANTELARATSPSDSPAALAEKAGGRDVVIDVAEGTLAKVKKAKTGGILLLACALLCFIACAAVLLAVKPPLIAAAIALGLLGAVLGAFGIVCFGKASKHEKSLFTLCGKFGQDDIEGLRSVLNGTEDPINAKHRATARVREATEDMEKAKERLSTLESDIAGFTSQYNTCDAESLASEIDRIREIIDKITRAGTEHELLKVKLHESEEAASGIDRASAKAAIKGKLPVEEYKTFNASEARTSKHFLQMQAEKLTDRIGQNNQELAVARATASHPSDIYARLEACRDIHNSAMSDYNAYVTAYEKIKEASESLHSGVTPALAKRAGELLSSFSGGKYGSIGINADFSLNYTDGNMTHSSDFLSGGTQDMVYIALRIALWELLFRKMKAPLFFDDSFAHTDDTRLAYVMSTLKDVADKGGQIVVLSCHRREARALEYLGGGVTVL